MVDAAQVPEALKAAERWVCWRTEDRDGTETKVPVDPAGGGYASVADPGTWTGFDAAFARYRAEDAVDGVGYVFSIEEPYAGVDLDDCRDPETGDVEAWARDVVERLDSYTERSPSGTGLHVLVEGAVPDGGNRQDGVELYDRDRYFTVTGDHVAGTPATVEERTAELAAVHDEYIADSGDEAVDAVPAGERPEVDLSDRELVERATRAANGDKFARLWRGDTSGYPSHSEADQALCTMLAFWTGGDAERIERLFGRSGLVRAKWRERDDYRERTIEKAIEICAEYYDPATA
ncbi:MAG: hypothetical protein SVU32_03710 [Candidatus Nanohaloarchaea archaeon]|nr:hypothetical protein [Candidatus Nanohaloarchaea archaeon]